MKNRYKRQFYLYITFRKQYRIEKRTIIDQQLYLF